MALEVTRIENEKAAVKAAAKSAIEYSQRKFREANEQRQKDAQVVEARAKVERRVLLYIGHLCKDIDDDWFLRLLNV